MMPSRRWRLTPALFIGYTLVALPLMWPMPAAAQRTPAERTAVCQHFAQRSVNSAQGVATTLSVLSSASGDPMTAQDRAELQATIERARADLVKRCLTWPEETLDCLGTFSLFKSGCRERVNAALGDPEPPKEVAPGPEVVWQADVPDRVARVALDRSGRVFVFTDRDASNLHAFEGGQLKWSQPEGGHGRWIHLVDHPKHGGLLRSIKDGVELLDPATGQVRWTQRMARSEDAFGSVRISRSVTWPLQADQTRLVADLGLFDGDGTLWRLQMPKKGCGGKARCLSRVAELSEISVFSDTPLETNTRRDLIVSAEDSVRILDSKLKRRATLLARSSGGHGAVRWRSKTEAVAILDNELMTLDLTRCRGESAPSRWPHPGEMYFKDRAICPRCARPPSGCVKSQVYLEDISTDRLLVHNDLTLTQVDFQTRAYRGAQELWRAPTGHGPMMTLDAETVVIFTRGREEGDPRALIALNTADGAFKWRTPLPEMPDEDMFASARLVQAGPWILVALDKRIALLRRP